MPAPNATADRWQIWIDRGGTFTDAIGHRRATGAVRTAKVLSGAGSVVRAVRALLDLGDDAPLPPLDLRLGTTLATNALLERRGARTGLAITRGFADLLVIGDQTRPELFALDLVRTPSLPERVIELDVRADAGGRVLAAVDAEAVTRDLTALRATGVTSLAVVVVHGWAAPALEDEVAALARAAGFEHVTTSADAAAQLGLLARAQTAVADAYLTPVLATYLADLRAELPGSTVRLMQSSGGLADAARLRGKDAILSGPAGGALATAAAAAATGATRAIGFDMGGTSTDVTCVDEQLDRRHRTEAAGVEVHAPAIAIHTVAAGGGSTCRFDGLRLTVGPDSAGADPGPLCYGRPASTDVALTDADLILGRLAGDHFPWPLDRARAERALAEVGARLPADDAAPAVRAAAAFFAVANAAMAEAVRQVTVARGRDVRDFALVVFGGAGAMHACPVASQLGVRRVIVPRFAGLLSAWGLGLAPATWHGELDGGRVALTPAALDELAPRLDELVARGRTALAGEHAASTPVGATRSLALRYRGSDTALDVGVAPGATVATLAADFAAAHRTAFGYDRDHVIEIAAARVEVVARDPAPALPERAPGSTPPPLRHAPLWSSGRIADAPVHALATLPAGATLTGPALVLDAHASIVIDTGWRATVATDGSLTIDHVPPAVPGPVPSRSPSLASAPDPVSLEVHANLYMSIATQMGIVLERTAVSTNIRERRDFSCALFDRHGRLVANAPHIPVHLGAMGETIRSLLERHPAPPPGTVYACNHPAVGGSHLPDITVVTPVHDRDGALAYVLANRGHHADVGGLTPGSMPPASRTLTDEGVVLDHLPIVVDGHLRDDAVRAALAAGPHPARRPDDNLADLAAQVAANQAGRRLVELAMARGSPDRFLAYMTHVQDQAAALVGRAVAALPPGQHRFADRLDDGSPIVVAITAGGGRLVVDFTGSAPAHPGNLNAPRAVTVAAVIYVVRALVGEPIPLNAGCLDPVDLIVPPGSLLDPPAGAAVAAGNVETSQRIVDVLLGALGLAAASQGTMNNLTVGGADWAYYETIGGGAGATPRAPGASAIHTHMTNTRITDPEVLEARFPVRLRRFAVRTGSGGDGRHRGGDGVVRELELLAPAEVAVVSQRRASAPFGLAGGAPGAPGHNRLDGAELPGSFHARAAAGSVLTIETPGGGGWGPPASGGPDHGAA